MRLSWSFKSSLHNIIFNFFHLLFVWWSLLRSVRAFYLWLHSFSKKVPMEIEYSNSMGGTITFITLFAQNYSTNCKSQILKFRFEYYLSQVITPDSARYLYLSNCRIPSFFREAKRGLVIRRNLVETTSSCLKGFRWNKKKFAPFPPDRVTPNISYPFPNLDIMCIWLCSLNRLIPARFVVLYLTNFIP